MEALAAFLFGRSRCFFSLGPIRTATGQIDHLVEKRGITGMFLDEWSSSIVVECKNWEEKIGSQVIVVIAQKAKNSGSNVAIVFCRSGLTGNPGFDGLGAVRNCYSSDRIAIMVLDENDLLSLIEGQNFIDILRAKWFEIKSLA